MSVISDTIVEVTNGNVVNGDWVGTGIFDILIDAVNKNIEIQYSKGRITSAQYADVYLGGLQAVLQQSIQFVLQADTSAAQSADILATTALKQREMVEKETNGAKQRAVMDSQIALYTRQKDSFDDNKYQKVLEAQMNYNSMIFADASSPSVLGISLENRVNDIYNRLVNGLPTSTVAE
jgi:hypothetical protein